MYKHKRVIIAKNRDVSRSNMRLKSAYEGLIPTCSSHQNLIAATPGHQDAPQDHKAAQVLGKSSYWRSVYANLQ